jgi:hypothetical protein
MAILESSRAFRRAVAVLVLLVAAGGLAWGLLRPGRSRPESPAVQVPEPTGITVEVLNGSNRPGLARAVTRELRARGFDVLYFGTARDSARDSEVLLRRGDSSAAARVASVLGIAKVRVAPDTLLRLDVTVFLGRDFSLRAPK